MHLYSRRGAIALAVTLAAVACSDTLSDAVIPGFYATLSGDQIVGAVGGTGSGTINFTTGADSGLTVSASSITGLSGTPTEIAIYVGSQTANGTKRADICGGSAPACAASITAGTAVTMLTGFTKGQLYTALHTYGGGYVTVGTALKPAPASATAGGELRGVIVFNPLTQ